MCMPEYLYGLILIDSLEAEAACGPASSADRFARIGMKSNPQREKKFRTTAADAGSLVPVGEMK